METQNISPRKGRKKKVKHPAEVAPCLGFRYTLAEERAIEVAALSSLRFMLRFGHGTDSEGQTYCLKKRRRAIFENNDKPKLMADPREFPHVTLDIIVCQIAVRNHIQPDDIFGFTDEGAAPKLRALAVWLAINRIGLRRNDVALALGRLPVAINEIEKVMKDEIRGHTPFWIDVHKYIERVTQAVYAHFRN